MARIALAVGIGVFGALTGGLGLFGFAASGAHAMIGFSLGMTAGQALGSILMPVKLPNQEGPRLADLTVSSSANGAPIPIGYGLFRFAGMVIWSPGLVEHSKTTKHSSKGGPSYSSTDFSYTASFAVAFGESYGATPEDRTGDVAKVWFDSKVVYDNSVSVLGINYLGDYDSSAAYAVGDYVTYTDGKNYRARQNILAGSGVAYAPNAFPYGILKWEYYSGTIAPVAQQKYPAPTIYNGTEAQTPDPLIQGDQGADNTPAFRGLIYTVWEDFPLADFGNRIPNIQALVQFGTPSLADTITDLCRRAGLDADTEVDVSQVI